MSNRIRNAQVFDARTAEYPVDMYIRWIIGGELDFDAKHQAKYVSAIWKWLIITPDNSEA